MFILSESISVQNLSSLTLKTKELWKGGGKHPPPPQCYNETKKPSPYRVKIGRARGKRKGKNTLKACVVSLLLFGQSKSMAARKAVNLIGQIYFDRMTGPPLVKEHRKRSKNWLALSDRSFLPHLITSGCKLFINVGAVELASSTRKDESESR